MKVKSTFKKYTYIFDFFIEDILPLEHEAVPAKQAFVTTKAYTADKKLIWNGIIRVNLNEFGIYPLPGDISSIPLAPTLKKMLLLELRRYIKPQKPFL